MSHRFAVHFALVGLALVGAPRAAAQIHPEIVIGCDASGKLVAQFDATKPYPLPPSRFDGIPGFADAMPGFFSLVDARPDEGLFPAAPKSNIVFVLVAADAGAGVWNDRGSGALRVGETFTLGSPTFDSHPVWNIAPAPTAKSFTLRLQLRDTTGRHRDSEVFAPAFAPVASATLYACPMLCEQEKTYTENVRCPVCDMRLKLVGGRDYAVQVTPQGALAEDGRVRAGVETTLRFAIRAPDGVLARDLEVVHEKLVHLLMVSEDLAWFAHEHPELASDGTFVLRFAFPHGGRYVLYHDFTPQRAGMQVVPVEIDVAGEPAKRAPLRVDAQRPQEVDGYTVSLATPKPLTALRTHDLKVSIARDGKPVTDLEPFLGALGHLIVISADRTRFVHSHPLEPAHAVADAKRAGGPEIVFSALFPAPGVYKAWAQFQRAGQVITAPFVIEVVRVEGTTPSPATDAPR